MYLFKRVSINRYKWFSSNFRFYRIRGGFVIHWFKYSIIATWKPKKHWVN